MKRLVFVLVVMAGLTISLTSLGRISPALGQSSAQDHVGVFVDFQDSEVPVPITDLGGNPVGLGTHQGQLRCMNNCSQKAYLQLNGAEYQYRFETKLALDPVGETVVVEGRGTISRQGQDERFSFTATIQNNGNGTVRVSYVASRPDASFIIPETPGTFTIFSRP